MKTLCLLLLACYFLFSYTNPGKPADLPRTSIMEAENLTAGK